MSEDPFVSYSNADAQTRALIEREIGLQRRLRKVQRLSELASILAALLGAIAAGVFLTKTVDLSSIGPSVIALAAGGAAVGVIAGVTTVRRRFGTDQTAKDGLLSSTAVQAMLNKLDVNDFSTESVRLRRDINREIRQIAAAVEAIPDLAGVEHPALKSAVATRVQGLLNLQVDIMMMHTASEKRDLHRKIAIAAAKFNAGAWVTLPEAEYIPVELKVPLIRRVFYAILSILFFGGLVAVIIFASNLGVAAPILSIIFTVAGISFLRAAGIMTQSVQEALDTAQKIYPTIKNPGADEKRDESADGSQTNGEA